MIAYLYGTQLRPVIDLAFPMNATHATTGEPLLAWVKNLPGRSWDPERRTWSIFATGPHPDRLLAGAGFTLVSADGEQATATDMVLPIAIPRPGDPDGLWEVHPRLGGRDLAAANLGVGALWRANESLWLVHPSTLVINGGREVAGWVVADDRILSAARVPVIAESGNLRYDGSLDGLRGVPLTELNGVTSVAAASMAAVGLDNIHALLHHIARRYVDLSNPMTALQAPEGETAAVVGNIQKVVLPPDRHGMLKATVVDTDGTKISCRWFNAGYMSRKVKVGLRVVIYGKVEQWTSNGGYTGYGMTNPLLEPVEADSAGRIIGIYPASGKNDLSTWTIYRAAREAVGRLGQLADPVPAEMLTAHNLPGRTAAFRMVHDPDKLSDALVGRDRLAYDELLRLQLVLATAKAAVRTENAYTHPTDPPLVGRFLSSLPFPMTGAQKRSIGEIGADMASGHPMHRLLQGEVGSGKTVVAVATVLTAIAAGYQAAFVAPTEILADQHYADISGMLTGVIKPDGVPLHVELLTNKVTGAAKKAVLKGLADGTVDMVIGTHSVLAEAVKFKALSCVVLDEQHRFGVDQRRALRAKGNGKTPDTLYATATPIPRTAAMTTFGDLDVAILDEMPPGRSPIVTRHIPVAGLNDRNSEVWKAVREEVEAGRQAFVVTPLVTASAVKEEAAAHAAAEDLAKGALAGLRIGVVTGKDKAADRRQVMAAFSAGNIDVLVATTVIEVGVNVPNATVMVVLGADKFGLAQLHQLRGRVGRGKHAGACFLVAEPRTANGAERMKAMVSTTDGFVLAELDLKIRGVGHITGSTQSGTGRDLLVADILADIELLEWAKADAVRIVGSDPHLYAYPSLRAEIENAVDPDSRQWLLTA